MSEEHVDKSPEAFGALLALIVLGSCANMSYLKSAHQAEEKTPKIEKISDGNCMTNKVMQMQTIIRAQIKQK